MPAQVTLADLLDRPELAPSPRSNAATAEPLQLFIPAPAPMRGQLFITTTTTEGTS